MASFTSSSFTLNYDKEFPKAVAFDSRIIPINDEYIYDYFKWRQDEAWRNCVNAYGIDFLKSKYPSDVANEKINGLNLSDIHELLFQNGINLNDLSGFVLSLQDYALKFGEMVSVNLVEQVKVTNKSNKLNKPHVRSKKEDARNSGSRNGKTNSKKKNTKKTNKKR